MGRPTVGRLVAPATTGHTSLRTLIVGAGIGGLALAVALKQRGLVADVIERAPALRPVGAGITLGPNAMCVLKRLDLGDRIVTSGRAMTAGVITDDRGRILQRLDFSLAIRRLGAPSVALHRARLHDALLEPVQQQVRLGAQLTGLQARGEQVTVTLEGGEQADYDLVVGADGIRSTVRRLVFGGPAPRYAGYSTWRFVVSYPLDLPAPVEMWGRGQRLGLVAIGRGQVYGFAVLNARPGALDDRIDRLAHFQRFMAGFGGPAQAIARCITSADQLLTSDIEEVVTDAWVRGRIALLGDAAHAMTPNLGQGAGMAIEDASTLADLLTAGGTVEDALATYQQRRQRRVRRVQDSARLIGQIGQWQSRPAVALRNVVLRLTPDSMTAQRIETLLATDGYPRSANVA